MARSSRGLVAGPPRRPSPRKASRKRGPADVVEQRLVAPRQGRPDPLPLGRRVPVRGRRHRAVVGGEADQDRVVGRAARGRAGRRSTRPASPISVARASPRCELWAQTTTFVRPPCAAQGARPARRASRPCGGRAGSTRRPRRGTSCGSTARRSGPAGRSARRRSNSSSAIRPSRMAYSAARRRRSTSWATTSSSHDWPRPKPGGEAVGLRVLAGMVEAGVAVRGPARPPRDRPCPGRRAPPRSRRAGCRGPGRRSRPWIARRGRASLWPRSQPTKSSTSALRHIQVGNRRKLASASTASASSPLPRT